MPEHNGFHDVLFPTDLALGSTGGPERMTEVVQLASGAEQRNARHYASRRRYNAGYGIKTVADLQKVIAFFEARRGRLYGFRFHDPLDYHSGTAGGAVSPLDQQIGTGDGASIRFQLAKSYGEGAHTYHRRILKPVSETVEVAVGGMVISQTEFQLDTNCGELELASAPASGEAVTAGFRFHTPVRFDTDEILINLKHFEAGDIPAIPLVELIA